MEQIQVPVYALNQTYRATTDYRGAIQEKLADFCTAQLRNLKLVTSTFSHRFYLRESTRHQVRGYKKLCSILERASIKHNPALLHALRPGSNSPLLSVEDEWLCLKVHTNGIESALLGRYLRYLTYLLRKSAVPVQVRRAVNEPSTLLTIKLRQRVFAPSTDTAGGYTSWLDRSRAGLTAQGKDPDGVFSNDTNWIDYPVGCSMPEALSHVLVVERLFVILPQVMQVIQTLSRKFAYAPSAFAVEPATSS